MEAMTTALVVARLTPSAPNAALRSRCRKNPFAVHIHTINNPNTTRDFDKPHPHVAE